MVALGDLHDVGGDAFFRNHGFEGGGDGVLKIAVEGDDAGVERDSGGEGGFELGGRPPDKVGEGGGERVLRRYRVEGVDQPG